MRRQILRRSVVLGMVMSLLAAGVALAYGTFRTVEPYHAGGTSYGVAIADLNKDGKGDIVALDNGNPGHAQVFLGNSSGDGYLHAGPSLTAGDQPEGVAIGNLNGAGRKDIAVANYGAGTLSLFFARTGSGFKKRVGGDLAAGPGAWQLAVGDLNGDGIQDLVTGNYSSTAGANVVSVLLGKGKGNFKSRHNYDGCDGAYGLGLAKMNGDNRPDVVVLCGDGNVSVFLDHANGTLGVAKTRSVGTTSLGYGVAIADFNRDGHRDVAVGSSSPNQVEFLAGKGTGGLKAPVAVDTNSQAPNGIAAADFNRDGKMDIAFGHKGTGFGMGILRGKGNGTFRSVGGQFYGGYDTPEAVAVGRISADKAADVAVGTTYNGYGLDVFINKLNP